MKYQCLIRGRIETDMQKAETGARPPCVSAGYICRGCPGWTDMKKAMFEPPYAWNQIHCPATGLTIIRVQK